MGKQIKGRELGTQTAEGNSSSCETSQLEIIIKLSYGKKKKQTYESYYMQKCFIFLMNFWYPNEFMMQF